MPQRRALVTGGGSGIGLAIARRLAKMGIDVTVAGRDARRLSVLGLPALQMDVTDAASVREGLARCGAIDIFVANAGAAETAPTLKTPREMWDRMMAVNLTSLFTCAQEAIPPMITRGWGRFIVVASTASHKAYPYSGAYVAAKHGALGWVRTLAVELAKTGVTANAVCPAFTDTPLISDAIEKIVEKTGLPREEVAKSFAKANPMGRLVTPEEAAEAAAWLASEAASSVNGQSIIIDGGEIAG